MSALVKSRALSLGRSEAAAEAETRVSGTDGKGGTAEKTGNFKRTGTYDIATHAPRVGKFEASSSTFKYGFRGLDDYFGGLEVFIGTPSPDIFNAMERWVQPPKRCHRVENGRGGLVACAR